ncbi:MAG: hypothetical protein RLP44_20065 [Aggregatilineales bacterium]
MAQSKSWFYKSFWLTKGKVAFLEIIGEFDEQGLLEFNRYLRDTYLDTGYPPVHCIIDTAGFSGFPRNFRTLKDCTAISATHPNMGYVVLIGYENAMLGFLATSLSQLLGDKFKLVQSLQEARALLKHVDDRLTEDIA